MIDNYVETMALMDKMEAQLPIPVNLTRAAIRSLRESGIKIKPRQILQVEKVHYLADVGGIACGVGLPRQEEQAVVVSLTHIRVKPGHPLAKAIRDYQVKRTRRLAQANPDHQLNSFTIEPRGKP